MHSPSLICVTNSTNALTAFGMRDQLNKCTHHVWYAWATQQMHSPPLVCVTTQQMHSPRLICVTNSTNALTAFGMQRDQPNKCTDHDWYATSYKINFKFCLCFGWSDGWKVGVPVFRQNIDHVNRRFKISWNESVWDFQCSDAIARLL
jgi:hypothetical protein